MRCRLTARTLRVDTVAVVEQTIKQIEETIDKLSDAHKNRLLVRFDLDSDDQRDRESDMLTALVTKKMKEAEHNLLLLNGQSNTGDAEVQLNVRKSMAAKLQTLSLQFRNKQKAYKEKLVRQKSKPGLVYSDDEDEKKPKRSADGVFHLSDAEILVMEKSTVDLQERDAEILKVTKNIEELATIFKELATLVIDQGTILDRIDHNMDNVIDNTEHAVKELKETQKIQEKNVANRCIIALLIIIFVLLVILVAKKQ